MKSFLIKYKRTIIFWTVFLAIILFFAPRQYDYYLDNDIKAFKQTYLARILVWTGIATSIAIFALVLVKTKSPKQSGIAFLSSGVTIGFFLFIFQDVFLGFTLFINRQVKRDRLERAYVANYLAGTDQTKDSFYPFDLSSQHSTTDKKLIDKIYSAVLRQNDTIKIRLDKGLFGIAFQSQPFVDK